MKRTYSILTVATLLFIAAGCLNAGSQAATASKTVTVQAAQPKDEPRVISFSDLVPTNTPEAIPVLQKLVSTGNVIVDFYALWCQPSKYMSPIIDALAQKYPSITFVKVDIDAYDAISEAFELGGERVVVKSVPTFYFLKNGVLMDKISGGMPKGAFEKRLANTFSL